MARPILWLARLLRPFSKVLILISNAMMVLLPSASLHALGYVHILVDINYLGMYTLYV